MKRKMRFKITRNRQKVMKKGKSESDQLIVDNKTILSRGLVLLSKLKNSTLFNVLHLFSRMFCEGMFFFLYVVILLMGQCRMEDEEFSFSLSLYAS